MRQASKRIPDSAEKTVRDIRRNTRRHHSAEEKIRVVLEGLRGKVSIAELCRKEGINQNLYYRWSKEFLEAGKNRPEIASLLAEMLQARAAVERRSWWHPQEPTGEEWWADVLADPRARR
jgi:transposase-like protein